MVQNGSYAMPLNPTFGTVSGSPTYNELWNSNTSGLTDAYRGFGSSWFNAKDISAEDFRRDLYKMDSANAFSAQQSALDRQFQSDEAAKNRQWQEEFAATTYQRQIADMKKAGINPIMAFNTSANLAPGGGVASGGTARSGSIANGSSQNVDGLGQLVSAALQIGAGLLLNKSPKKFKVGF